MFYNLQGSGPTVLLIHGFPLDQRIWAPQVEELSRDFTVVVLDLRGHGRSEATQGVYLMEQLASDAKALLDHIGVDRIVLGGLSMGGYVAFAFLREFGEMVRGLILCDTRAEADSEEAKARREQQAVEVLRDGTGPLADRLIGGMLTAGTRQRDKLLTGHVYDIMRSQQPVGMAGALRGMARRPDSTPLLGSVRVPTLIVVGEEDQTTPLSDARKMASGIKDAELVVVPNAAHLTSLERPVEVNVAVRRFLERLT